MYNIKMLRSIVFTVFLSGLFMTAAGVSLAQQEPKLELKTTVDKEIKLKKNEKWVIERVPAVDTAPGDVLVYTIAYTNVGKAPLAEAVIVNPLPEHVAIIPTAIEGKETDITCSINHGRSWHKPPVMMKVRGPDGKEVIKKAPPERYTHIRWIIKKPVLPGQTGQVGFKVTVK